MYYGVEGFVTMQKKKDSWWKRLWLKSDNKGSFIVDVRLNLMKGRNQDQVVLHDVIVTSFLWGNIKIMGVSVYKGQ